ncbi:MAG: universal stress protein [Bacteroidia bacterium]|jgi:nucleotide-binding universal stress UspA family protein
MSFSHLKNKPSFPFETIATAIAFSPRCKNILAEAQFFKRSFKSKLVLIHVGEKTTEKQVQLEKYCAEINLPLTDFTMLWKTGDVVEQIMTSCKAEAVDLLLMGAVSKENMMQFYIGSIARKLCRKAKCSVLLLTQPQEKPSYFNKMVVNHDDTPKSKHTLDTAIYFAQHQPKTDIYLVNEVNLPALALSMADGNSIPEAKQIKQELLGDDVAELKELCSKHECETIRMASRTVNGKPGFAIANFAKTKKADLLVLNSPDKKLGILDRIFTHDIEHVLADLPCNLLIVHSRTHN